GFAAPIVADGVGERLPVAGRAVEVDERRDIAVAGVDLWVPTVVEVIGHRALRPAMDDVGERVLLLRIEADWLDAVAVHLVAERARKTELLVRAELDVFQHRLVYVTQTLERPVLDEPCVARAFEIVVDDDQPPIG